MWRSSLRPVPLFVRGHYCARALFVRVLHCPLWEIRVVLRVRHNSRTNSATHFYQSVQYFRAFRQRYGCQCSGFLTCVQILMHVTAHRGCTHSIKSLHWKVTLEEKNPLHISLGNQTHISIVLGFSACCSTHWAYLKKCIPPTWNFGGHVPRANKCSPWGFSAMRHIGQ